MAASKKGGAKMASDAERIDQESGVDQEQENPNAISVRIDKLFNDDSQKLKAIALFLRFGMSVTILQGLFLFFILLFASWSDLTDHEVTDWVWISLIPVALMSIPTVGLTSMIAGAFVVFIPQIAMALLPPHKTLGGADIKISAVLAFMLGFGRGIIAYLVALVVAVIFMNIYNKVRKRCPRMPFALVPFLAGVAFIAFLI